MKNITLFIIGILTSCKTPPIDKPIYGVYFSKGKDYEYRLTLLKACIFELQLSYQDAQPTCTGNWKYFMTDTILLECSVVEDPMKMISSAYMNERNHKIIILNPNQLKYKNTILNKVK